MQQLIVQHKKRRSRIRTAHPYSVTLDDRSESSSVKTHLRASKIWNILSKLREAGIIETGNALFGWSRKTT